MQLIENSLTLYRSYWYHFQQCFFGSGACQGAILILICKKLTIFHPLSLPQLSRPSDIAEHILYHQKVLKIVDLNIKRLQHNIHSQRTLIFVLTLAVRRAIIVPSLQYEDISQDHHFSTKITFVFMSMLQSQCLRLFVMLSCHAVQHSGTRECIYVKCIMLILGTCLTTFVFMSRLKTECLQVKMAMFFFDSTRAVPVPVT